MGRSEFAGSAAHARTSPWILSDAACSSSSVQGSHRAMASASPSSAMGAEASRLRAT